MAHLVPGSGMEREAGGRRRGLRTARMEIPRPTRRLNRSHPVSRLSRAPIICCLYAGGLRRDGGTNEVRRLWDGDPGGGVLRPARGGKSKSACHRRFEGLLSELLFDDPDDVNALTERLKLWHSRREVFGRQAALLSERLRRWTWDDMAARMVEIIEEGQCSGPVPLQGRADSPRLSG